jgi:hypothetical protein
MSANTVTTAPTQTPQPEPKATYYSRHREARLAYSNAYYAKNREKILQKLQEQRDHARVALEILDTH